MNNKVLEKQPIFENKTLNKLADEDSKQGLGKTQTRLVMTIIAR